MGSWSGLMKRILVIRGGAIGDFILTLPVIRLLRDRFPRAHIEILGNIQIATVAEKRFYADAIRSIEQKSLAAFFTRDAIRSAEWSDYFRSFDLVLSYIFDPERIFQNNLRSCGIGMILEGPPKLAGHEHAAFQLARPLEGIGLRLQDPAARIYPNELDREFARHFLSELAEPVIAFHPGSGSERKNWSLKQWGKLGEHFFAAGCTILVVAGEADEERRRQLEIAWKGRPARFVSNLALPQLAALLERVSFFVGHDSGVSHIAAAVGTRTFPIFGQTDPATWAPANEDVTILQAPAGNLQLLRVDSVIGAMPVMN